MNILSMTISILLFGQLSDLAGADRLTMEGVVDTDQLAVQLQQSYPSLAHSTYVIAVDKNIITGNTVLTHNSTVALLPPFSGG